jgi:exosortase/archaeosortase family protein
VPVYHTSQYLTFPNDSLEVANACSGIRYLVSIVAMAIPLVYLTQDTWQKKIILVISSIVIGIIANPIRIAIIGVWVYNGGSILHGPKHMLQGYFVSVVGFAFLFITAFTLNRQRSSSMQEEKTNSSLAEGKAAGKRINMFSRSVQTVELKKGVSHNWPDQKHNYKTV